MRFHLSPKTVRQLNELGEKSIDYIEQYSDTPTLAEVRRRQLLQAEADLLKAVIALQEKYLFAHSLRIQAEPNSEVDSLLNINGINKPK